MQLAVFYCVAFAGPLVLQQPSPCHQKQGQVLVSPGRCEVAPPCCCHQRFHAPAARAGNQSTVRISYDGCQRCFRELCSIVSVPARNGWQRYTNPFVCWLELKFGDYLSSVRRPHLHFGGRNSAGIGGKLAGVLQQLRAFGRAAAEAGQAETDARPRPAAHSLGRQLHGAHGYSQALFRCSPGLPPAALFLIVQHHCTPALACVSCRPACISPQPVTEPSLISLNRC